MICQAIAIFMRQCSSYLESVEHGRRPTVWTDTTTLSYDEKMHEIAYTASDIGYTR